ncbi:hypothetical protein TRP8649_03882 [Pelagimonas phthalicica]|uniref:Uncharacterized protein n=1 Tax=Pelagimonas phthalicica TaxID=1037362 RepID=A0A238JH63_9RHOB|nr:hypothetical protein [Pelagimonas phthalicica]TDS89082.1 hypothetical protein CLV87_4271 [Pelagimonas phthalicica]SMX29743.1 hypothetical protein TRP8649_03882 [Pelagimonas phthalicica]
MLRKIRLLPFLLRWSWAYHGGFGGMSDEVRLKRLARLNAENGPKQVILTQRAAAHWRLGQTQDAVTLFRLARESELDWGGRKRRDVSEYLVEYCAYCVNLGSGPINSQCSAWKNTCYQRFEFRRQGWLPWQESRTAESVYFSMPCGFT